MSYINSKKFETLISNIDKNSYRAFHNILTKSTNVNKSVSKSPIRKQNTKILTKSEQSEVNYPFNLRERRFKWVTEKSGNLIIPLKGNFKKYEYKKNSGSDWEGMVNRSQSSIMKPSRRNYDKREKENSCTFRRIIDHESPVRSMTPPPMLTSFHSKRIILENYKQDNNINDSMRFNKNKIDDNFNINYQGQKNFNKSSNTSGTFAYLMDRTQDIQKKYKKYSEKMLIGNNIFTHENYNYKKQRKYVNIEKERKNYFYAGNNIPVRDEIVYFNLKRNIYTNPRESDNNSNFLLSLDKINKFENQGHSVLSSSHKTNQINHSHIVEGVNSSRNNIRSIRTSKNM